MNKKKIGLRTIITSTVVVLVSIILLMSTVINYLVVKSKVVKELDEKAMLIVEKYGDRINDWINGEGMALEEASRILSFSNKNWVRVPSADFISFLIEVMPVFLS